MADYRTRVARGAALLDAERPGWADQIGADTLAMESCDQCVLGQLYGNYWQGCRIVWKVLPSDRRYSSSEFGFTLYDSEQQISFDGTEEGAVMARFKALADAWRVAIRERTEVLA